MPGTWAISGVDLHLDVPATRVRTGLETTLRDAVRSGRLAPGVRLPSSRQLARDLGLARNTVADAYGQLVAEGWLTARQGSGTQVAARPGHSLRTGGTAGASRQPRYDLRPGVPDLAAFPATAWVSAARRALSTVSSSALGYGDPRGRIELRETLADYLARARGVLTSPDRIVVCSGFIQGLGLVCEVLRQRGGRRIGVEEYGQPAHRKVIERHGLAVDPLPVDDRGAIVDAAGAQDAVLLTPAHQFPLGPSLAADRRGAVAAWAARTGALVLEDDYDGEFRYDRHPIGAVQALDPEHVVYLGTASKTLAPGVRLGWLALPADLVDDVIAAKAVADAGSGAIDQLALAQLIAGGGYDRHIRRSRLAYRRRRDTLVAALARHVPGSRVTGIAAGLHALVRLPEAVAEADVVARGARHDLALEGLGAYAGPGVTHPPALVTGYATPPAHAYTGALARLTATLREVLTGGRHSV
jgi:GntR family transcriptional regulator/MocR family aminotransferase